MANKEFRVLGERLGERDGYVDVVLDGVDKDGTLHFVAKKDPARAFSLTSGRFKELTDEGTAIEQSAVNGNPLWNRVSDLGSDRKGEVSNANSDKAMEEAQEAVFRAAREEER